MPTKATRSDTIPQPRSASVVLHPGWGFCGAIPRPLNKRSLKNQKNERNDIYIYMYIYTYIYIYILTI